MAIDLSLGRAIRHTDSDYPARLNDLPVRPSPLYAAGDVSIVAGNVVAIVGTRTCTKYGERVAYEIARELAGAGVCIVSGLARGIDVAAHRGALAADGLTCAVLGTGLDVAYPVRHASMQRTIAERGLLLTEYHYGVAARKFHFLARNRIIAALARATIVVEGGRLSGALKTAGLAVELGRDVAAVPGPIDSQTAVGTNELLRDGAIVIGCVDDALALAGVMPPRITVAARDLTAAEQTILRVLGTRLLTAEQIVDQAGLPVGECLSAVGALELEGMIEAGLTGELRRRPAFARHANATTTW